MTKICSSCRAEKSLEEFRLNKKGKFGRKAYCRPCDDKASKENYLKNQQKRLREIKEWNARNPDKVKKYQKSFLHRT
jgi:hypothetical protein